MPNVKPGDLAYITHPTMYGALVDVLYRTPDGAYTLPDGAPGVRTTGGLCWICAALGSRFEAPMTDGTTRRCRWVSIPDIWLRPFRVDPTGDADPAGAALPERAEV